MFRYYLFIAVAWLIVLVICCLPSFIIGLVCWILLGDLPNLAWLATDGPKVMSWWQLGTIIWLVIIITYGVVEFFIQIKRDRIKINKLKKENQMKTAMIMMVVLMVLATTLMAEQSEVRVFAIGGKQLTENFSFTSVSFLVRNSQGDNIWSFNGPRYLFGQGGFIDAFVGLTFPEEGKETYALSPRLRMPVGRFYIWQDLEWYPEPDDWYSATVLNWRADSKAGPGEGLEFGLEFEAFKPGNSTKTYHYGPFVSSALNDKMSLCLAWHKKSDEFGGNFIRLSGTFLFF